MVAVTAAMGNEPDRWRTFGKRTIYDDEYEARRTRPAGGASPANSLIPSKIMSLPTWSLGLGR